MFASNPLERRTATTIGKRQLAACAVFLSLVFSSMPTANAQSTAGAPLSADQATMVIMAPTGPVFVDLQISVAKIPYREWVGKFLATQLDADRNGRLNLSELNLLTESVRQLGTITGPEEVLKSVSADPVATDVSTKDFAAWLRQRLPRAFDLIAQPQSSDDAVRLSTLIDLDQNSVISDDEIQCLFRTLRFRDLDNDETFSVSELMPYRDPRSQNAAVTPDVVNLPFFHVTDDASRQLTADRILHRYGDGVTISSACLRQPALVADKKLDAVELAELLQHPEFHLSVPVRLSDRANTSDIDVHVSAFAAQFCKITDDSFGQTAIAIDGLQIQIVARGGGANNRAVSRGFLGQTFVMIDTDKNQYLDESEFTGIVAAMRQAGSEGTFAEVDQNGDKMVVREELFAFTERDFMAAASRIEVTVKQDGKTMFGLMDQNQDRRLSAREVRGSHLVLQKYDLNADGIFAETEMGTQYVLTLGLGRPEIRRSTSTMMGAMNAGRGDAILPGTTGLSGPEWFRRMDRNQDGDVSIREFLGTPAHFKLLDKDNDQLISAAEAESI